MRIKPHFATIATHAALLAFIAFLIFPLLWMLATSFKPTPEIYSGRTNFWPSTFSFEHYRSVSHDQILWRSMANSLIAGLCSALIAVLIATPAAYALTRFKSAINKMVLGWMVASQIFPAILMMIPLYMVLRRMQLTDSLTGLTLVYVVWALPFVMWMLHGYFKSIPADLEEAAALDGASRPQIIFHVLMPLLLPSLAAAVLFAFISAWNEFFFALVLMKSPSAITLPVELARFTGMEGQARTGPLAAASFLATIPSVILFGFMRKWFASGLLAGAVKN